MAEPNKTPARPKDKMSLKRWLLIIVVVLVVMLIVLSIVLSSYLNASQKGTQKQFGKSTYSVALTKQMLLATNNATLGIPYALFNYNTRNVTNLLISVNLFTSPPPTSVYLLNSSNECFSCGNVGQFSQALSAYLTNYTIFNSTNGLQIVQPTTSALEGIKTNSVLIIPNGYLPDFFLAGSNGTRLMDVLLSRGVSIIYIGQNFSKLISSQSVLIPDQNPPSYLSTFSTSSSAQTTFYFNKPTFTLAGGARYGPVSYESASSGHLIVFANYLSSWTTPAQAASDVATVIFQSFWVRSITGGSASIQTQSLNSSGTQAILMNQSELPYSAALANLYGSTYGRIVLEASNDSFSDTKGISYKTMYFRPSYSVNGTLAIPNETFPGQPITAQMQISVNSQQQIEPHIDIYTTNLTYVQSLPPFFTKTISSNYTFFNTFTLSLPAGGYVAELNGFSGQHYAVSYFTVPGVSFNLLLVNYSIGAFIFSAYAGGKPLSNVTANITLGGKYPETVVINNGGFIYRLPLGVSTPTGNLSFTIGALNQQINYNTTYSPPSIVINKQYIEFIIAIIIVILEITLVKAPTRDDFYVDVPNMPEPAKQLIKLKSSEILTVFDKLNLSYHWRYMPLSTAEFKYAISNNLRSSNLPVTLTYSNIYILLDNLASHGSVTSIDGLYAPTAWIDQSKHDIEYLATFKKMRVYLVSHAHIFTDLDKSDVADIVTTLHNEKAYIVIYSKTSKFVKNIPVQPPIKTYLVFLNTDKMDEFKNNLYISTSRTFEELKMYISTGSVVLLDADNPEGLLT